jgi:hypothetical protein
VEIRGLFSLCRIHVPENILHTGSTGVNQTAGGLLIEAVSKREVLKPPHFRAI